MKSKKLIIAFVAIVAIAGVWSNSVFAKHHSKTTSRISYSKCNISNCTTTSNHTHNGKYYYGHSYNDGHSYHNTKNTKYNKHH